MPDVSDVVDARLFGETFVTLFVIMDPLGTVPIFLSLTATMSPSARARAARQAVLVAIGVIVAFAVFGQQILDYLHITLPALQAAGGLLLLLVALELLTGHEAGAGVALGRERGPRPAGDAAARRAGRHRRDDGLRPAVRRGRRLRRRRRWRSSPST